MWASSVVSRDIVLVQLELGRLGGGDVEHEADALTRAVVVVAHDGVDGTDPDRAPVGGQHPELLVERRVVALGAQVRLPHAVAVVGVHEVEEEARLVHPARAG